MFTLDTKEAAKASPQADLEVELPNAVAGLDITSEEGIAPENSKDFGLVILLLESYLLKPREPLTYALAQFLSTDSVWFRYEPFYTVVQNMRSGRTG